jgi:alpha-ketoglutarate-dependent taurine dioxygenase
VLPATDLRHRGVRAPIRRSGRKILYANPGYTISIDGMDPHESDTLLDYLFRHQQRADFLYAHHWAVGDVLMWDNIRWLGTIEIGG